MNELQRSWIITAFMPESVPVVQARLPRRAVEPLVMSDERTDNQLVARMARGDQAALGELYARHGAALSSYLLTLTRDPTEVEEILQDTLVGAWQAARRFQGRSQVRTWLFAIARRQAFTRRRRPALGIEPETELERVLDPSNGPEELALAQVEQDELEALVNQLSPIHREILDLALVHELAYVEIAQVLDVPVGTVKSRMSNAKRALQRLLAARREANR